MFRIVMAVSAAMLLFTPAQAQQKDCSLSGLGYISKLGRLTYNFGRVGLDKPSDVKTMLTYSSNPPTPLADFIDMMRSLDCAAEAGDTKAMSLRNLWAGGMGLNPRQFNAVEAYAYYETIARHVREHLAQQSLSPVERQLLANTAAWAQATGNRRFANTLPGFTRALNLPPPN